MTTHPQFSITYALDLSLPGGKRPGYYAQIIKALAERTTVSDRDKELLVFASAGDREAALPVMAQYAVPTEELDLLLLPNSFRPRPAFTDYGFRSRLERAYLYAATAVLFQLQPAAGSDDSAAGAARSPEPRLAAAQLEEHLLGDWKAPDEGTCFAMGAEHDELAVGIARAYGCTVHWLYRPSL
ncbi:hypothetical protein SAMN02799630_01327 [Paenibacillus sp. UNCCL117]|uniref:hypothetical protein n=1 Tax=unclassified Paenibacillus TaxID=185978 RepID=UPI0008856131|nr:MULTISPECIES: hypothetical protein [unclassified Paenibacillus]SDC73332.1 hypothetical protein SAMN04488602_103305 [Paenibacillus sp. cl123]SFW24997.1 hypothetical protein SAMN02799630_01327 [Paenibacillus sp. UNCCL117]